MKGKVKGESSLHLKLKLALNLTSLLLASEKSRDFPESPATSQEVFINANTRKDVTFHFVVVIAQWEESG